MNNMNNNPMRGNWRLVSAALGAVVLMAGAGCTCVTINVERTPAAQSGSPPGAPAGGNFVPVQALLASSGQLTVCNPPQPVSGTYVRFYPPYQVPNPGDTGFRGHLYNLTTGVAIPNTDYYLQWIVTGSNTGCCTPLGSPPTPPTDVTCPVTPGLSYRFIAHFKTGKVPTGNPAIELLGTWTQ